MPGYINNVSHVQHPFSEQDLNTYFNHALHNLLQQGYPEATAQELAQQRVSRLSGNQQFQDAKNNFLQGRATREGRNIFSEVMGQLGGAKERPTEGRIHLARHINEGMGPERDYIQNYLGERAGYLDPMIEEASEKFLNRTSPSLRAAMAGNGLFQSSARHQAEAQAAAAANKEVRREAAKRGMELQRQGEESYQRNFGRNLGAGEALQKAFGEEGEAFRLNAQAMQHASLAQQAEHAGDIDRAMQFAHKEQEDEQRALDMERKYQEEVRTNPITHLQKIANIRKEMPVAPSSTSTVSIPGAPTPPNPLSLASGMLNQAMGMQQAGGKKRGGHIKGYAEGGYVGQETPEQQTMQEIAKIMNRGQGSPEGAYLRALGARQIAGSGVNGGSPLENLGIGMMEGEAAHTRQRAANTSEHAQAANLHNMIESSRRDQQIMIDERENKRATEKHNTASLAEEIRHHDLQNTQHEREYGETRRLHDATIERERAHADYYRAQGEASREKSSPTGIKITKSDEKEMDKIRESNAKMKKAMDLWSQTGKDLEENPALTGRLAGYLPNVTEARQKLSTDFSNLIVPQVSEMGGQATRAKIQLAEDTKPSFYKAEKVNKEIVAHKLDSFKKIEQENNFIEKMWDYHHIPPRVSRAAYSAWEHNNFEGDIKDYVQDAIEGRLSAFDELDKGKEKKSSKGLPDFSSMSDEELERLSNGE